MIICPLISMESVSVFLSDLPANYLCGLCVNHLFLPPSICNFSLAAA